MRISVIIPTLADRERASSIWSAIESILSQPSVAAIPLVVINGTRYDAKLRRQLEQHQHIRATYQAIGSLSRAIAIGRRLVDTDFFAFLDDDDVLLPDSLGERVEKLAMAPLCDALVSSGYCYTSPFSLSDERFTAICENPLKALFVSNWLASCAGTYRTATIPEVFYDDCIPYFEWTDIAFRLATSKRLQFESECRFRLCDTSGSLSKDKAGAVSEVRLWGKVAPLINANSQLDDLRRGRLSSAHHYASNYYRANSMSGPAWKHHVLSITSCPSRGWRYLSYTRHLMTNRGSRTATDSRFS